MSSFGVKVASLVWCAVVLVVIVGELPMSTDAQASGLDPSFYKNSCPNVHSIVREVIRNVSKTDPRMLGSLIRLHFHDCFVQGCDASILLNDTKTITSEQSAPPNSNSIRGLDVVNKIKTEVEKACPGVVSCADILALAARDAVFFAGGPVYDIPKGRKDGTRSKIEDTINLPSPNFNASDLIKMFGQHGFSAQEMVALSGAHTIGVARCSSFKNRLTKVDPNLNSEFANTLSRTCSAGDNAEQPFDETRDDFDNLYFDALVSGNGVLTSDQTLFTSPRTRNFVNSYAQNQALFFLDFQQAMVKMSLLDIKEGSKGQVRDNCRKIN